ncbi:hypothetical protein Tco_0809985 [Tanacetum coccineum]
MKRAGKDLSGRITPLFDTMIVQPEAEVPQDEAEHKESVPTPSNDPQPSSEDSMQLTDLMVLCTKLQTQVLDLQKAKDAQAKEIVALRKRIQRLERRKMSRPTSLKRLRKVGMSQRVVSSEDQESLGTLEDASKQGRSIEDIDADVDVSLVDETQERQDDDLMFDSGVLEDDVMHVEAKVDGKDEQSKKPDDSTTGEAVTTSSIDDSVVPTTNEEITLAQTLVQIKAAKPKVVSTAATIATTTRPKDRGVVVQEPIPLKRKDQIALDEQIARDIQAKLDAELLEEQKLARKQEEEANIALIEYRKAKKRRKKKESSKKQKVEEVDEVELKKLLVIKKDEDIAINAIPLATKLQVVIDYKLHKEGIEELEALWRIVKAKYGDTRPEDEFKRVLYEDLKVMFEPDVKSDVWRMLQGYRVTTWKLIDSSGVHFVRFDNLYIFMLVERRYPLTPITITNMLNKKLQTDHQIEMSY